VRSAAHAALSNRLVCHVQRRVVITGCGVLSAAGSDIDAFWRSLTSGRSFIGPLTNFTCPDQDPPLGAELEIPAEDALSADIDKDPYRARCANLALAASRRAIAHACLKPSDDCLSRAGVVLGTTMGEERQIGDLSERWAKQAADSVDAGFCARADNHKLAANIATRYGLGGPVVLNATACSSGNTAIAWAYDLVAEGTTDVMIAGGADTLTRLSYCGFARMSALSKTVCKPFDTNRDGVSFGEGAGILVVEELEHARKRGVRICAEILGYGVSNDAHHVTAPEPNGAGFVRAIEQALTTTNTSPDQIGYVCAHGTGTKYNDQGEVRAVKAVFGERANRIPMSSIKAAIGHTNGAAGAIATIACTLALIHQMVPPTATLVEPDPEFGMDFVMGQGRAARFSTCLNMSAGFGGSNLCLLLARAP
jgi:3-oxoacyl-[acyl-carrier-protein] synthase II